MHRIAISVAATLLLVAGNLLIAQDKPRTWSGTWNNRKFNTSGPLTCTASAKDDKTWQARFEGTFMGRQFRYDVTFDATKNGNQTDLKGSATIDGNQYEWSGYVRGTTFYGRYRSNNGYFGEFNLKQSGR